MKTNHKGLNNTQVEESRKKYGSNKLSEITRETFWDKLKGNLEDPIIKILILALIINVIFALMGQTDWLETLGIALAVTLATMIGTWSEYSNEAAFQKTQADAEKIRCKVYRNGHVEEIIIDDIVKGDLIILQSGDKIPADGKLIEGNLSVDQASLNGESDEAKKIALIEGEDVNFKDTFNKYSLFRGTVVTSGEAIMEVLEVGDTSLYGQMAAELSVEDIESPLKAKLRNLAEMISKVGYTAGVLIFFAIMFQRIFIQNGFDGAEISNYFNDLAGFGTDLLQAFILGVIIIVVAVPEGLPLMIALVLSLNMKKMLKSNVLVRKLIGIETSGNLNILFSDKTGTITKGLLEVVTLKTGDNQEFGAYDQLPSGLKAMVHASVVNNTNALISKNEDGSLQILGGNATEKAVLGFVDAKDNFFNDLVTESTVPFSSARKFSATKVSGDLATTFIKGAPEKILPNCTHYYDANGEKQVFTNFEQLNNEINELANRSIRVLVLATTDEEVTEDYLPTTYTLVSILGIRDDVRPEAVQAIAEVQAAGIQVVMITGDRKETAVAIAKESNILRHKTDVVLTSQELNELSDDEVKKLIPHLKVISRALPTDKSRLVRLSQELGLVVGMTGDGVNDGPALKRADVGFAMGSGTEVAKEAGDIVILDDNFQSIAQAVLYGRTIYRSIQKFITFQLTLNVAALVTTFVAPFLGVEQPLTITQMLWVNLVMDSLGALAFGSEPTLRRYMKEKPKRRTESIVTKNMYAAIITSGLALSGIGMWFLTSDMVAGWFHSAEAKYTAYFAFFILFAVVNGFNARTDKLNIFENITKNPAFIKIMALIVVVQVTMIYIGGEILRTVPISLQEWGIVIGLSLLALPIGFARKLIFKAPNTDDSNIEFELLAETDKEAALEGQYQEQ